MGFLLSTQEAVSNYSDFNCSQLLLRKNSLRLTWSNGFGGWDEKTNKREIELKYKKEL